MSRLFQNVQNVSKCPISHAESELAILVQPLLHLVLLIGISSFFYRALASIFSVFVEASVVVNKGRVVVSTLSIRTTQHVVIYRVVMNIRVVIHYRLTSIDVCEGRK